MTEFGNWSRPGVPHKGWTCTDMFDAGDDLITCQMCEFASVRYVHVMQNPEWDGELQVGCHCAARMEENYQDAEKRETEFKRKIRNSKREVFESLAVAADKLLRCSMDQHERAFVNSIRERMAHSAQPRTKKYELSDKQAEWLVALYKRYVENEGVETNQSDNEKGMRICLTLSDRNLSERERQFVSSIMQQIRKYPSSFHLSERQFTWLADIWRRKVEAA